MTHDLPPFEPFAVKCYVSDEYPSIKGNGFDGLLVGSDREEAEEFVAWLNAQLAAIAPYKAEIERLQYEVVNRNRRALEGDQAQANWDAQYDRAEKAEAENAKLRAILDAPPAQMSTHLGLLPIDSTGMRALVDECAKLREFIEQAFQAHPNLDLDIAALGEKK